MIHLPSVVRRLLAVFLMQAFTPWALAAEVVRYEATTVLSKSQPEVLGALLAYGQWCEKGCKYKSPGVVVDKKVAATQDPDHFYTWTWIRDIKDTKYFSEITVRRSADQVTIESRALTRAEKSQINKLEKTTGYQHDVLFDASRNLVTVKALKSNDGKPQTKVRFATQVTVSGFLAMFPGKLKQGLSDSTQAVFDALRR
jgi:hypothetical protein